MSRRSSRRNTNNKRPASTANPKEYGEEDIGEEEEEEEDLDFVSGLGESEDETIAEPCLPTTEISVPANLVMLSRQPRTLSTKAQIES